MHTAASATQSEITAYAPAISPDSPLLELASETAVEFAFSDLDYCFSAPVTEISATADRRRILVKVAVDDTVNLVCGMKVKWGENGGKPRFDDEVSLHFESARQGAREAFVVSLLQALFWLGGKAHLRLPAFQTDAELSITPPLGEIGPAMRRQMMAHRSMLIERAYDLQFTMPQKLSRAEEDQITFAYHAIADRSFDWSFYQGAFPFRADEQTRDLLSQASQSGVFKFELATFDHEILGERLALGRAMVALENASLVNAEEINREFERLDGHEFEAVIRTMKGAIEYEFPDAPQMDDAGWGKRIEDFIGLDSPLGERHFQMVNSFAAASLPPHLSEEEKDALTAPMELDEEAFDF